MKDRRSSLHYICDALWEIGTREEIPESVRRAMETLPIDEHRLVQDFVKAARDRRSKVWQNPISAISTRSLAHLPDIEELRNVCRSIATLEAIISPEWEWRYYSFISRWATGESCASMRNGSGDDFQVHFGPHGALIKGFAHEYIMSPWSALTRSYYDGSTGLWPGVVDQVPEEFRSVLDEPAFDWESTTFCVWRRHADKHWNIGDIDFPKYDWWRNFNGVLEVFEENDPDGSNFLLDILDGRPESYKTFADGYYANEDDAPREFDLAAIEHVYRQRPLNAETVHRLNSKISLEQLSDDISEIGYPG